jgi:hypothetical protein
MSETGNASSRIIDETGRPIASRNTSQAVEPLVQYMHDQPVCTALMALALGYVLGKIF